jgi:putative copper resistance protein D
LFYARALHFAATLSVAGVVFFVVLIAEPAFRHAKTDARIAGTIRNRLAWVAWLSLIVTLASGVPWLVIVAMSMSGRPLGELYSQGVLGTVLTQTDFGNDWLARFAMACLLGGLFVRLFSKGAASPGLKTATALLAAALVASLAFAGHAIGGQGIEGLLHPAADVMHLVAAAAWIGALVPLILLLKLAGEDSSSLAAARAALVRFSTLGIASVATLLATGGVNTWYLTGSIDALLGTGYGRLLLAKVALFFGMVAIAAVNRLRLTPRAALAVNPADARRALRQLRYNAALETMAGTTIIGIVAILGILPPGSHAHHADSETIPADASFQHIHTEHGMADVTIEPGRVGLANVTIQLWDEDENPLDARQVTLTLAPPAAGAPVLARPALQGSDGRWRVEHVSLLQPGDWTVTVNAALGGGKHVVLTAPIVIDAK